MTIFVEKQSFNVIVINQYHQLKLNVLITLWNIIINIAQILIENIQSVLPYETT